MLIRLTPLPDWAKMALMARPDYPKTMREFRERFTNPKACDEYVFRFNRRQTPMASFQTLLGITVTKKPQTMGKLRLGDSSG